MPTVPVRNLATEAEREAFSSQFALAKLGVSSLCLDLHTGDFFQLNATSAHICAALLGGKAVEDVEQMLCREYGLSPARAGEDVGNVLAQLRAQYPVRETPRLQFKRAAQRWRMHWDGAPVLDFDPRSEEVFWARSRASADEVASWLRVAVPHLLVHRGHPVLHASAVRLGRELVGFCGPSGSGKSTCASLLCETGAVLVSEDLLVVQLEGAPEAFLGGEGVLREWAAKTARRLGHHPCPVRLGELVEQLCGPTVRLSRIIFLDEHRRTGSSIALEQLSMTEAAAALLENGFGELGDQQLWRNLLRFSSELALQVPAYRGIVPAGMDPLRAALKRYRTSFRS